ncbi:MAG: MBL fold metallo-hydrolase [Planctomycetota bacterium]
MKKLKYNLLFFIIALVSSSLLYADIIHLDSGGKIEGKIISKDSNSITVRTTRGTVDIPLDEVVEIEESKTVIDEYEEKLEATPKDNADAIYKLALWCKEKALHSEAKTHFEEVVALKPDHKGARAELGYVKTPKGWEIPAPPKKDATEPNNKPDPKELKEKPDKTKPSKPAEPIIKMFYAECNVYVLACSKTKEAALIDSGGGKVNEILQYIEQNKLTLKKIIITHNHKDHLSGLPQILASVKVDEVLMHESDPGFKSLTGRLKDGDTIQVGTLTLKVIHTPGHTPGSICLYLDSAKVLFSGDTLFKRGGIGRTRDVQGLKNIIKNKLMVLDDKVAVYAGHDEPTTIGAERKHFR